MTLTAKKVAVLGYAFRFPGTSTAHYWQDMLAGRDLVTEVDATRWALDTFRHPDKNHPGTSYTFASGSIGDVAGFDAGFFGISPREAALMDPQQRLLLEMSWEALENAGVKPSRLRGSQCGVYIGIASSDYAFRMADDLASVDSSMATGNTASIAANRISYVLDLHGPSMAIDTACSSSMVAFHQACRAIVTGECTHALTGGVSLHLHPYGFIIFSKATMLSKRGRCQVFDAAGDGYVRSEGGGMFVLKDYDQAVADGDTILAVVAGSAVNTDGRKSGLTIPSPTAQAALMTHAYAQAGIDPAAVDYVEAHGTGTAVGDPIETRALGSALGMRRDKGKPLLIGSVKSNLGHMEAASGVAGLVKALHCIQHRMVPATIGLDTPNPNILFDEWNIEVATTNRALKKTGKLIVGVNSFGFGGSNAHIILESPAPAPKSIKQTVPAQPLPIMVSARDEAALKQAAQALSEQLLNQPRTSIYDLAYSLALRREAHPYRVMLYSSDTAAIAQALQAFADDIPEQSAVQHGQALPANTGTAFVYSGNGSQWAGMGKRLLIEDATFRANVREVDALFQQHADYSLEAELAGDNGADRYALTEVAQPALFAIQVGLTRMLAQRGIVPTAVVGHSVGEVAAAWACGALSLADAVAVIYHRSHAQALTQGNGQMTAVALGQGESLTLLDELNLTAALTLAGINSPQGVTLAGAASALTQIEAVLAVRGVPYKRLDLDYAFHSPAMDSIETRIKKTLAHIQPRTSTLPFYSTVSGAMLAGERLDARYWWLNIRQPVLFESAVQALLADGTHLFVEVGPHPVMRSYVIECLKHADLSGQLIPTLNRKDDTPERVWAAASQVIIAGGAVDWPILFPVPGAAVALPNYPWQRERHWHPVSSASLGLLDRHKVHPLLGYALQQQELSWENQLDALSLPSLADHVVGDATVFPGTGFAELALAAALAWQPGEVIEIEDLEIRAPLLLSETHAKILRLHIDASDGSVSIRAREHGASGPYTLHAVARILREPSERLLQPSLNPLPTREPDFTHASHAALTQAAGLAYGSAFQRIAHGWIEGDTAQAVFAPPATPDLDLARTHLHPALLDCTFQLIIQLLQDRVARHEGMAFVPTRMGRIVFRAGMGAPHSATVRLLNRAPHSLSAEFAVFDADGHAIAIIQQARFHSIRLHKNAADHLRFLDFHCTPAPHPHAPSAPAVVDFDTLQARLATLLKNHLDSDIHHRYADEIDPLLDSLCSHFSQEALAQLADTQGTISQAALRDLRAAAPAAYLDSLLAHAQRDGSILASVDGWQLATESTEDISAEAIWNSLVADYPDYFQLIHACGRIGMHLNAVLTGQADLTTLRPAEVSSARILQQVLGADSTQHLSLLLQATLSDALLALPDGERLGILEIAAHAPVFGTALCAQLDFNRSDYIFASTDADALEQVAQLSERYARVSAKRIDDNPSRIVHPRPQLVIVTLDADSPQDNQRALEYAVTQLGSGGSLLVIAQTPTRWLEFILGTPSAAQPATYWQQQLQQSGLAHIQVLPDAAANHSGAYLLLGRQPARVALHVEPIARTWLVLADAQGDSAQLALHVSTTLRAQGHSVRLAAPGDAAHIASLLLDIPGQLDGVIHLAGITPSAVETTPESLLDNQVSRCATAAALIQACESTQTTTTCWLITTGVSNHMLPTSPPAASSDASVDAALWGFGRTLMNEASNYSVRMVDLETLKHTDSVVAGLCREFTHNDSETEIILSRSGARYAPRLRLEARPGVTQLTAHADAAPSLRLGFQLPGQLRNLRWEAHARVSPAPDQIEVAVHATGLNFRDVMYALGLLSDEAIENGFAGSTLGLEFAGEVLSVGTHTLGYQIGDRVVGFGPSSFSNRVLTQSSAIAHIPEGMSFEAASTIPSTFLTVYYALHQLAQLQAGEKVLIHGAAGGVGIAAIQLAKWLGADIYATAGSDEKRDFLRLLGVTHIYDSRSLAYADAILADTGGAGVDVVLNSLAGDAINRNFSVLKPFGRFLELGKRDFYENTKIGLRPFRNNISYFGIDADQLMQKRPDLTRKLFGEVMALFAEGVLHPLPYQVFEAEHVVDAFRHMQQARQIGKIVVTYRQPLSHVHMSATAVQTKLTLPAHASYLVTGGLSGFGLKTAQWLATKGARNLVLVSRSGPVSSEARTAIAQFKEQGVTVHAVACDVTDKAALAALLKTIATSLPPLKGIVHAAMVIDDGLVRGMDAEQIRHVLAPKVLGAHYLHALTRERALDYFILFSSATTLFGNPGQGNYVAANAALEALARQRRGAGLAATCVRWGAIDDAGFLARNVKIKDALQSRMGGAALNSAVALDALESLLLADRSGLGILELDWKALARFLPSAHSAKFSEMAQHGGEGDANVDQNEDMQGLISELSDDALLDYVITLLKTEVGEILRVVPDKIDATRSIYDMGLDSLMGVELVVALESRFGIRLSVMALSASPTIAKLAERMIAQLKASDAAAAPDSAAAAGAQVQRLAEQHGAEVSAESIASVVEDIQVRSVATDKRMIH